MPTMPEHPSPARQVPKAPKVRKPMNMAVFTPDRPYAVTTRIQSRLSRVHVHMPAAAGDDSSVMLAELEIATNRTGDCDWSAADVAFSYRGRNGDGDVEEFRLHLEDIQPRALRAIAAALPALVDLLEPIDDLESVAPAQPVRPGQAS